LSPEVVVSPRDILESKAQDGDMSACVLLKSDKASVRVLRRAAGLTPIRSEGQLDRDRLGLYETGIEFMGKLEVDTAAATSWEKTMRTAAEAEASMELAALRSAHPTYDELIETLNLFKLYRDAVQLNLPMPEICKRWWKACYCYGELARTLSPRSYVDFCEQHFDILKPLGARCQFLGLLGQVVNNLTREKKPANEPATSWVARLNEDAARTGMLNKLPGSIADSEDAIIVQPFQIGGFSFPGLVCKSNRDENIGKLVDTLADSDFKLAINPDECYMVDIKGPILTGVIEWIASLVASGVNALDVMTAGELCDAMVCWNLQGHILVAGTMGIAFKPPPGAPVKIIITSQFSFMEKNSDRFTTEELSTEPLLSYIHTLESNM
jgi:hypothetical protein